MTLKTELVQKPKKKEKEEWVDVSKDYFASTKKPIPISPEEASEEEE